MKLCKRGSQLDKKAKYRIALVSFFWSLFSFSAGISSAEELGYISIPIHPLVELDYKTKAQIYRLRRDEVMKYPYLLSSRDYAPSEAVFGQIQDSKPWWGIYGLCYHGDGEKSIEGPSEESRFIMNPFLLVSLDREFASRVHGLPLKAPYPEPANLVWKMDRAQASVTYQVTRFCKEAKDYYPDEHMRNFLLEAYNARDLGYEYLYVDEQKSENIVSRNTSNEPLQIPFFIHLGSSCKYPGGCNNSSPTAPNFFISITSIPAKAYIKLWRKRPVSKIWKADMVYIIQII